MEHLTIKRHFFWMALIIAGLMQSCYYDNEEDLYPQPAPCDTTNITYSQNVWPIVNDNCTSCHSGSAPSGNISLTDYNEIVDAANDGSLLGTIRHDDGWSPMPKGGGQLPDCDIKHIEIWVDEGTPNN